MNESITLRLFIQKFYIHSITLRVFIQGTIHKIRTL